MGNGWAVRRSPREASTLQGHEALHVGQYAWAGLLDNEETDVIWSWVTLCSDVVGTPFKLRILRDMNYGYYTVRDRCHVVLSYAILWCRCYFYAKNTVLWTMVKDRCYLVLNYAIRYYALELCPVTSMRLWMKVFLWRKHPQTILEH